jgi:hypothetical protein
MELPQRSLNLAGKRLRQYDFLWSLVIAPTEKRRLPQLPIFGPFSERHFADELWLNPFLHAKVTRWELRRKRLKEIIASFKTGCRDFLALLQVSLPPDSYYRAISRNFRIVYFID